MVEMALLFGLGVMGVVLSNLLAGEGGSSNNGIATLPRSGRETAEEDRSEAPSRGAPPQEVAQREAPPRQERLQAREQGLGVGMEVPYEPPRLWGHPAPLAKLIALITMGGALLTSVVWGAGWLLVRAIARSLAGG